MRIKKKLFNALNPILKPLSQWYLSRTRTIVFRGIRIKVFPGIFHPTLFVSTKVLLKYLDTLGLKELHVLELGAGTGLISIYCHKKGAHVTASDINPTSIHNINENAKANNATISIIKSDLFNELDSTVFDLIIINPPYYPKEITLEKDLAWFCGLDFEYFDKLFFQLQGRLKTHQQIIMILSEDCDIERIDLMAKKYNLHLELERKETSAYEINFIYTIKPDLQ